MSHGGLKRARSWKRRIQPKEAYSSPGLLYSEVSVNAWVFAKRKTSCVLRSGIYALRFLNRQLPSILSLPRQSLADDPSSLSRETVPLRRDRVRHFERQREGLGSILDDFKPIVSCSRFCDLNFTCQRSQRPGNRAFWNR